MPEGHELCSKPGCQLRLTGKRHAKCELCNYQEGGNCKVSPIIPTDLLPAKLTSVVGHSRPGLYVAL